MLYQHSEEIWRLRIRENKIREKQWIDIKGTNFPLDNSWIKFFFWKENCILFIWTFFLWWFAILTSGKLKYKTNDSEHLKTGLLIFHRILKEILFYQKMWYKRSVLVTFNFENAVQGITVKHVHLCLFMYSIGLRFYEKTNI